MSAEREPPRTECAAACRARRAALGVCRSRTALLWGLAGFVVLQLGLAVVIERWMPEFRDPFYAYKATRLRRRTVRVPVRPLTVVMLGTSRTAVGFKAGDLEQALQRGPERRPVVVFNFGLPGAGPVLQLLCLKRLLNEGVRPDLLLVEVLPPLWNEALERVELERLPADRLWLRELPLVVRYGAPAETLRAEWWQSWATPWHAHRYAILSHFAPTLLSWRLREDWFRATDASGWVDPPYGPVTPERQRLALENARREYSGYFRSYRLGGSSPQALHELLTLCHREGIPLALVWMPESRTFRSWYPHDALAEIERFLSELSSTRHAPLIDARTWVADEQFADGHHLLPAGASVFTERLRRESLPELLGPWDRDLTHRPGAGGKLRP